MLKKKSVRMRTGFNWLQTGFAVVGSSDHDNESLFHKRQGIS
jgi:hypothetical protein